MTSDPSQPPSTHSEADVSALLETLANFDGRLPATIREDHDNRRRILEGARKLICELETPADTSQRLLYSELEICAARIGVDLNVFTILSASTEPMTTDEIASQTGTDPDRNLLYRLLQYMASVGIAREVSPGMWAQSNYGSNLVGKQQSAGICHVHDSVIPAYLALPEFLRLNKYRPSTSRLETAFTLGHNVTEPTTFFDWLKHHPKNSQYFHDFMGAHRTGVRTWLDEKAATDLVDVLRAAQDRSGAVFFVDVGGGLGQQCKLLKSRYPDLKGRVILQDLPDVVEKVTVDEGTFEKMGIDFFQEQPVKGSTIYYLRSVLRDWSDESCETILRHIRAAMDDSSVLLIDDIVLPNEKAHRFQTQLDLTMLAVLNAQARTYANWQMILAESGLLVSGMIMYEEKAREAIIIARRSDVADMWGYRNGPM